MIKYFCDKCGVEITEANECVGGHISGSRLGTKLRLTHELKLELLVFLDGTANNGIFCKYCIIDAFKRLDDRPQPAPL